MPWLYHKKVKPLRCRYEFQAKSSRLGDIDGRKQVVKLHGIFDILFSGFVLIVDDA